MINVDDLNELNLYFQELEPEKFEVILNSAYAYNKFMAEYECALLEVETKLRVLNKEFSIKKDINPIEHIKSRLKSPISLIKKLKKRNIPFLKEEIEKNIFDLAGVRVICSYVDDVYRLVDSFKKQYDINVIEEKDYIKTPKLNGYRSYHIIIEIPVFLYEKVIRKNVEIQFRTIGMDFWATLEHNLRYKRNVKNSYEIQAKLFYCAQLSAELDEKMKYVKDMILEQSDK